MAPLQYEAERHHPEQAQIIDGGLSFGWRALGSGQIGCRERDGRIRQCFCCNALPVAHFILSYIEQDCINILNFSVMRRLAGGKDTGYVDLD